MPSDYQAGPRHQDTSILVGHWTAGEAGIKTTEDDGYRVVSAMQHRMSRKHPDQRLKVSVGFVIGACGPDDQWAPVWQTMDIGTTTGVHVGSRHINRRSIGVEIVNAGVPGRLDSRRRPQESRVINGNTKTVLQYYPGQIRTWQRLALLLTTTPAEARCKPSLAVANALHDAGIIIPRSVPFIDGKMLNQKMARKQAYAYSGVMEHHHMYNTKKIDAANYLVEACEDMGFVGKPIDK